jgi:hypothetical protein
MFKEDKLFNFMAGLRPWAQTELKRQDVRNLTSALALAKRLLDYKAASKHWDKKRGNADRKGKADVHFGLAGGSFLQS